VAGTPADTRAFGRRLFLWDSWWMLGGVLFCIAAAAHLHRSRRATNPNGP